MTTDSPWRSFWDRAYDDGDHLDHWEAPAVPPELVAAVEGGARPPGLDLERLRRPGAAAWTVDLGCGTGLEAVWLARRGFRVAGVDDSRAALALARRRAAEAGVQVTWHHASVFDLPLADGSVGFAVDRGCFHALHPEDRHLYADEVARVLAPGGALFLRGAAREDEEAGLWPVDEIHLDLFFGAALFDRGPLFPVPLAAGAGTLDGQGVWLLRTR